GRTMPLKGLDRLLDLVDRLDAEDRRVRLVALLHDPGNQFVGRDGDYASRCVTRLRARDPELTEIHVDRVDVGAFYAGASVLVVPNRILRYDKVPGESWGRIVPEALAAGLPVVSTDAVPSAVEYVVDGENGTVVPWDDEPALAAAVRRWLLR
ncbi:MAG: glycosyltransferase family 4 protein, partial [Patulibacter sp.]